MVRCYSLSDSPTDADAYRVTVKKILRGPDAPDAPPGLCSTYFNDHVRVGDILDVKAPSGNFVLSTTKTTPVVLIAGGIGITPVISMLNAVCDSGLKREVWFFLGVRNGSEHLMRDQLQRIQREYENIQVRVCYSQPAGDDEQGRDYDYEGFVGVDLFKELLPSNNYEFYVCGPPAMMSAITAGLADWGVPREDVHFEAFGPATVKNLEPGAGGFRGRRERVLDRVSEDRQDDCMGRQVHGPARSRRGQRYRDRFRVPGRQLRNLHHRDQVRRRRLRHRARRASRGRVVFHVCRGPADQFGPRRMIEARRTSAAGRIRRPATKEGWIMPARRKPRHVSADGLERRPIAVFALFAIGLALGLAVAAVPAAAQELRLDPAMVEGPDACGECHKDSVAAWKETHHATTFRTLPRKDKAREIADNLGLKRIKAESTCLSCHFTSALRDGKATPIAGITCESCHAAGKDWIKLHSDYGGKDATKETETPEHAKERYARSEAARNDPPRPALRRGGQLLRLPHRAHGKTWSTSAGIPPAANSSWSSGARARSATTCGIRRRTARRRSRASG